MTGMRRGEILGLRWSDVDLDNGRLSVRQAVISVAYKVLKSTPIRARDPGGAGRGGSGYCGTCRRLLIRPMIELVFVFLPLAIVAGTADLEDSFHAKESSCDRSE